MPKHLSFFFEVLLVFCLASCSKGPEINPHKVIQPGDTVKNSKVSTTFGSNATSWLTTIHNVNYKLGSPECSSATDPDGNVYILMAVYGIFDMDPGPAVVIGGDSTIIYSAALVKYDRAGKLVWSKQFKPDGSINRVKIIADHSGNIYCRLHFKLVHNLQFDGNTYQTTGDNLLLKFNGQGEKQWMKNINLADDDLGTVNTICTDYSGNLYLTGVTISDVKFFDDGPYTLQSPYKYLYFYAKYDPSGKLLLAKNTTIPASDYRQGAGVNAGLICVDRDENVYIAGQTILTDFSGPVIIGNYPVDQYLGSFVTKFDKNGNWDWFKEYKFDTLFDLGTDAVGGIYTVGLNTAFSETNVLKKIDANGNDGWTNTVNTGVFYPDMRLIFDNAGNAVFVGDCIRDNPHFLFSNAVYINKYSPSGASIYQNILTGYDNVSEEHLLDVGVDNAGSINLFGTYVSTFKLLNGAGDPRDAPDNYAGGYFVAHFPDKQR